MTLIFILGPTASGKTEISISLAKRLNGEIIGADSIQIYRDLVVGSAAPSKEETGEIPCHLIGIYSLKQKISAGIYLNIAAKAIDAVESAGKIPIVVGGTNFYVEALIKGLSPIPEIDEQIKQKVEKEFEKFTAEELFLRLLRVDAEWAEGISSRNDKQRIKRGLLVWETTGKKLSDWNKMERIGGYRGDFRAIGIKTDREILYQKIGRRAEFMVKNGLIEEVQKINAQGFNSANCKALNSIGYIETEQFLQGKIQTRRELVETISKNTRRLAKRQLTWLNNRDYLTWKSGSEIVSDLLLS